MFVKLRRFAALIFCFAWLFSCGAVQQKDLGPPSHRIYVTSNGWHSAIVVPAPALRALGAVPETADFPSAEFFEFGWGDRDYYQAKEKTFGMTLSAALVPTPAVMHIAGKQAPPEDRGQKSEVISLWLSEAGFERLVKAIAEDLERASGKNRAESISRGLYPDSYFYNARGDFHLLNTCNTWTARKLRIGGVAISPSGIVTADELMDLLHAVLAE